MIVLGLETSSPVCSVGLASDDGALLERSVVERHIHSEQLLMLLRQVLDDAGRSLRQVEAVAVSAGPGSFTGLRIGMSTAKGLCLALDKPLVPVSSMDVLASALARERPDAGSVLVVLNARQGDFYVSGFVIQGGLVQRVLDPLVLASAELARTIREHGPTAVVTDDPRLLQTGAAECLPASPRYRGDVVAVLGRDSVRAGRVADVREAEPVYLKDFVVKLQSRT